MVVQFFGPKIVINIDDMCVTLDGENGVNSSIQLIAVGLRKLVFANGDKVK